MHTQTALVKDVVKGDTGSVVVETCRSVYRTVECDWGGKMVKNPLEMGTVYTSRNQGG